METSNTPRWCQSRFILLLLYFFCYCYCFPIYERGWKNWLFFLAISPFSCRVTSSTHSSSDRRAKGSHIGWNCYETTLNSIKFQQLWFESIQYHSNCETVRLRFNNHNRTSPIRKYYKQFLFSMRMDALNGLSFVIFITAICVQYSGKRWCPFFRDVNYVPDCSKPFLGLTHLGEAKSPATKLVWMESSSIK